MVERPLRIGFVTPEYPTGPYTGGIGTYVRQMAQSLVKLGHSPSILLCEPAGDRVMWDGPVPIHRVSLSGFASHLPAPLGKGASLMFARVLARLCKQLNLDLVEAPEFAGLTAFLNLTKPLGLRVIVRLHSCTAICRSLGRQSPESIKERLRANLQDWLERRAILTADVVTAISQATVEMTKTMLRLTRDDFRVTVNPVNDLFFSPVPREPVFDDPLILFVGRLQWLKGPDLLIRALPAILEGHPDVRLCLAGGDTNTAPGGTSMFEFLSSLIPEQARPHVQFAGFLKPEQLFRKYHQATVCAFPSRWEGFGLVAAEAMACGKAVVVSDNAGFRELISHGVTGLIAKEEDPESLASAINLLLRDSLLCRQLGAAAKDFVSTRFHGSAAASSALRVYQEALSTA